MILFHRKYATLVACGMKEVSVNNFGLLIAYVVPGFTALWGASYFSATLRSWLHGTPTDTPTVSGFLYVTIGSIAAGVTVSAVRWAIVDSLHHRTGIPAPDWDFSRLQHNVSAYSVLVSNHYQFFQYYANQLVALTFWYLARRLSLGFWSTPLGLADLVFLFLAIVLFAGSRDALRKYYTRGNQLFGTPTVQHSQKLAIEGRRLPILSHGLKMPIVPHQSIQPPLRRHGGHHGAESEGHTQKTVQRPQ